MFVLNASFIIRTFWMVAESFMDPVTRTKIRMSMSPTHSELTELMHPDQLLKQYGGNCDPPAQPWPPTFPAAPNREDYNAGHINEEELKKELLSNPRIVPPPQLAEFARANCKSSSKKGSFPRKTYYLNGRIERRDSFNGIIEETASAIPALPANVVSEAPIVAVTNPAKTEEVKSAEPLKSSPDSSTPGIAASPPGALQVSEVKLELQAQNPGPTQVDNAAYPPTVDARSESPPKSSPKTEAVLEPEIKNKVVDTAEQANTQISKVTVPVEGAGEVTAGSTSSGANPRLQPHFGNKGKSAEGDSKSAKACCACVIL